MTVIPPTWTRATRADRPGYRRYHSRLAEHGLARTAEVAVRDAGISPLFQTGQVDVRTLAGEPIGTYSTDGWVLLPDPLPVVPAATTTPRVREQLTRAVETARNAAAEARSAADRWRDNAAGADADAVRYDADADAYEAILAVTTATDKT